ncbi:MAG: glycosyltransferase [Rhodospirillaceae bacterium]|nr:glycosyltransferase [Rhodospirillaceae bacterium]
MTGCPIKVLHVITELGLGGAESMLTRMLTKAPVPSVVPEVVSLVPGGANRDRLVEAGVAVSDLGLDRGRPRLGALLALARRMRAGEADIVQGWMYHANLAATLAAALPAAPAVPVVWGIRCSDMDTSRYGWQLRAVIGASARLSRRPAGAIANSQAGIAVHRALGFRPRRFDYIANGLDTDRFRPDPAARAEMRTVLNLPASDSPVLAVVARVDPMKDHAGFLAALDKLPGAVGLAIGKGTEDLPDRPNLRRLGPRTDVPRLLAAADFIVNSSAFGEGFSNAVAEGMAAGCPAVATDVGDARLIVGETGRIVPPRDPAALAEALAALIAEEPAAREERRRAARQRIETEFALDRAAEAFAALHREILAETGTARR